MFHVLGCCCSVIHCVDHIRFAFLAYTSMQQTAHKHKKRKPYAHIFMRTCVRIFNEYMYTNISLMYGIDCLYSWQRHVLHVFMICLHYLQVVSFSQYLIVSICGMRIHECPRYKNEARFRWRGDIHRSRCWFASNHNKRVVYEWESTYADVFDPFDWMITIFLSETRKIKIISYKRGV